MNLDYSMEFIENQQFYEYEVSEIPPIDIVSFTELRSVADIVRMYLDGQLTIDPEFQREFVWKNPEQTRFIDSLIKQLPIPSMCLSLDYKTQTWQVIDGLQRISTVIRFLTDDSWSLSKLPDVDPLISGKKVADFIQDRDELGKMKRIVENSSLPINVLRCDFSKKTHQDYIFEIFRRLNTGGKTLSNQEIRNCVYSGSLNNLLNEMNKDDAWLRISKLRESTGKRYRGQEMILRVLAFSEDYEGYNGKLANYLNHYMAENRNMNDQRIKEIRDTFLKTVHLIDEALGDVVRSRTLALFESFLVGFYRNFDRLENAGASHVEALFEQVCNLEEFSQANLKEGLASKEKLISRMRAVDTVLSND